MVKKFGSEKSSVVKNFGSEMHGSENLVSEKFGSEIHHIGDKVVTYLLHCMNDTAVRGKSQISGCN